jgi:hypothetical protein
MDFMSAIPWLRNHVLQDCPTGFQSVSGMQTRDKTLQPEKLSCMWVNAPNNDQSEEIFLFQLSRTLERAMHYHRQPQWNVYHLHYAEFLQVLQTCRSIGYRKQGIA